MPDPRALETSRPAPSAPPAAGGRLPRGRHGLSREEVARSQRERIIHGMAAVMVEDGYVGTSVTAILKRAGVSRQTFYEQFASKEECFAATYAWSTEIVVRETARVGVAEGDAEGGDAIDRMLGFYLRGLASAPAFARVLLIETYAAGPDALEQRITMQRGFARTLGDVLGATTDDDRFTCEALVGSVVNMATSRLATGDVEGLLALHRPLAALLRREAAGFGGARA